jgi:hypothetical protein
LRRALSTFPGTHTIKIPWQTRVPSGADDLGEPNLLRRVQHVRAEELPLYYKVLVPRVWALNPKCTLARGSHYLAESTPKGTQACFAQVTDALRYAHYPIRSPQQVITKLLSSYASLLLDQTRLAGQGEHSILMYRRLMQELTAGAGERELWDLVYLLSQNYACTEDKPLKSRALELRPLPDRYLNFNLRYGEPVPSQALLVLAGVLEQQALKLREISSGSAALSQAEAGRQKARISELEARCRMLTEESCGLKAVQRQILTSYRYRLGRALLSPLTWLKARRQAGNSH